MSTTPYRIEGLSHDVAAPAAVEAARGLLYAKAWVTELPETDVRRSDYEERIGHDDRQLQALNPYYLGLYNLLEQARLRNVPSKRPLDNPFELLHEYSLLVLINALDMVQENEAQDRGGPTANDLNVHPQAAAEETKYAIHYPRSPSETTYTIDVYFGNRGQDYDTYGNPIPHLTDNISKTPDGITATLQHYKHDPIPLQGATAIHIASLLPVAVETVFDRTTRQIAEHLEDGAAS